MQYFRKTYGSSVIFVHYLRGEGTKCWSGNSTFRNGSILNPLILLLYSCLFCLGRGSCLLAIRVSMFYDGFQNFLTQIENKRIYHLNIILFGKHIAFFSDKTRCIPNTREQFNLAYLFTRYLNKLKICRWSRLVLDGGGAKTLVAELIKMRLQFLFGKGKCLAETETYSKFRIPFDDIYLNTAF